MLRASISTQKHCFPLFTFANLFSILDIQYIYISYYSYLTVDIVHTAKGVTSRKMVERTTCQALIASKDKAQMEVEVASLLRDIDATQKHATWNEKISQSDRQ